jgi:DNA adenine methylase
VNRAGKFNVPKGTKETIIFPEDNFHLISTLLKGNEILNSDFESVIDRAESGDFIFCDPPYTVKHNMNGFVKYNEKIFSWSDQKRLFNSLLCAKQRGYKILLTNAAHQSIVDLYSQLGTIMTMGRHSVLAASPDRRNQIEEAVIFTGFEWQA